MREWNDPSPLTKIETTIEIAAPPERVWSVLMDPDRLADWVTIHRSLGEVSDRPLKRGSEIEQTLKVRGLRFEVRWRVTELEEGHRAVWEGRGPAGSKAITRYEVTTNGNGGTRFSYVNDVIPPMGSLGSKASRVLIGGVSKREATRSLEHLKELLER